MCDAVSDVCRVYNLCELLHFLPIFSRLFAVASKTICKHAPQSESIQITFDIEMRSRIAKTLHEQRDQTTEVFH